MDMKISYEQNGIEIALSEKESFCFPLDQASRGQCSPNQWERLNAAEQLWYYGLLEYVSEENLYILSYENYYQTDEEIREILQFPASPISIGIAEKGNIGRSDYKIIWYPLIGNSAVGKYKRTGPFVHVAGKQYCLTEEQYKLVAEIDARKVSPTITDRAAYHAEITELAKKAGAALDKFTEKREFLFSDGTGYELVSDNDHEIEIRPVLQGVSSEDQDKFPDSLGDRNFVQIPSDGIRKTVFLSPEAKKTYNSLQAIPTLKDSEVPKFLDSPAAFFPEDIPFDPNEFSERVKGLKIHKTKATPFINIIPDNNRPGWFDVETGYHFNDDAAEDHGNSADITCNEELQKLIEEAAQRGETYIYHSGRWINVDPEETQDFIDATRKIEEETGGQISQQRIRYLLDVYENVNGLEYGGNLLSYKNTVLDIVRGFVKPLCFQGDLFPHQIEGCCFIRGHFDNGTGVLLADDMGLGKTVQIIAFLASLYERGEIQPALLIMPKTLLQNWYSELRKFLPDEKNIYIHQGAQRSRNSNNISKMDVVMTTYETLSRDQEILGRVKWSCVICDEVQKIKNFNTVAASAVKGMNTSCRIAMTGTPVENRLSELWSIVDFVQPGLLSSYRSFRKEFETPIANGADEREGIVQSLIDKITPIFLRRVKEDVLADALPEKTEETSTVSMTPKNISLYRQVIEDTLGSKEKGMLLSGIQKMLMICSHPRLVIGNEASCSADQLISESEKLQWTVEKVREIFAKDEKVIIFTKYKKMQMIIRYVLLEKFGIDAKIINGDVSGSRLEVVNDFSNRPGKGAIILSPKAAGVGLTITAANHVIHYTREWNPAVENQATDRAYRIGQKKPVTVYYPVVCANGFVTAEERLDELLKSKRDLMRSVVIPSDLNIKTEDFSDLLA